MGGVLRYVLKKKMTLFQEKGSFSSLKIAQQKL